MLEHLQWKQVQKYGIVNTEYKTYPDIVMRHWSGAVIKALSILKSWSKVLRLKPSDMFSLEEASAICQFLTETGPLPVGENSWTLTRFPCRVGTPPRFPCVSLPLPWRPIGTRKRGRGRRMGRPGTKTSAWPAIFECRFEGKGKHLRWFRQPYVILDLQVKKGGEPQNL